MEKEGELYIVDNRAGVPMPKLQTMFLSVKGLLKNGASTPDFPQKPGPVHLEEKEEEEMENPAFVGGRPDPDPEIVEELQIDEEAPGSEKYEPFTSLEDTHDFDVEEGAIEEDEGVPDPVEFGPEVAPDTGALDEGDLRTRDPLVRKEEEKFVTYREEETSLVDLIRSARVEREEKIDPMPKDYLKQLDEGVHETPHSAPSNSNGSKASSHKPVSISLANVSNLQEKDLLFAIAFCNPHVRKVLGPYAQDPYWSETSKKIIKICLDAPKGSWIDPFLVISLAEPKLKDDAYWIVKSVENVLKIESDSDASTTIKVILSRLKVSRAHSLLKSYDGTNKDPDHLERLMKSLEDVQKRYGVPIESKNLWEIFGEIASAEPPKVYDSFFPPLNRTLGYDGYLTGQLVIVAGAPARGKTTFLLNEAVHQARMGRKVLYFALADMTKEDLSAKIASILLGLRTVEDLTRNLSREEITQLVVQALQDYAHGIMKPREQGPSRPNYSFLVRGLFTINPSNVMVSSIFGKRADNGFLDELQYVASNLHIAVETESKPYIEDIQISAMSCPIDPDIIIIDYDRSIKAHTKEGLYHEGEEVYEGLVALAKPTSDKQRLVLVASQIHKNYWSRVSVPLEAIAESSRKQAIADIVITIGRDMSQYPSHMGYISVVKNRRGPTGVFPYLLLPSNNIFEIEGSDLLPPPEELRSRVRHPRREKDED